MEKALVKLGKDLEWYLKNYTADGPHTKSKLLGASFILVNADGEILSVSPSHSHTKIY